MIINPRWNLCWVVAICCWLASPTNAQDKSNKNDIDNRIVISGGKQGEALQDEEAPKQASDILPSEQLLPESTRLWISLPNASALKASFDSTKFGELTRKESLKPFVDKVSSQIKNWLDEKNVELGIKTDDFAELHTGEICIAAVLPDGEGAVKNYGFAVLVDVTDTQLKAKELLARLKLKLEERKAKASETEIAGLKAIQWNYPPPGGLRRPKFAFHILTDKWLLVCDNKDIARQIASNIVGKKTDRTLSESENFIKVRKESNFVGTEVTPQIKFYIEPFGYFDIVQDIAKQNAKAGEISNDHIRQMRASGFDAIKAIGGNVALGGEYEAIARAFVYAPPNSEKQGRKYKDAAEMLNFLTEDRHQLVPESFVPGNASGYLSLTWDMKKAFNNVKPLFDRIFNEGAFDDLLNTIHKSPEGPRVDLAQFVGKFHDRISVFTENVPPINETSEKIVLSFRVRDGKTKEVFEELRRMNPVAEPFTHEGQTLLLDEDGGPPPPDDDILDIVTGDDDEDEEMEDDAPKPLFDRRVYAIVDGNLLLGNDLDYVKRIVSDFKAKGSVSVLKQATDIREMNIELNKFVDKDRVTLRQFFRLDESIRVHYEMLRAGKMGSSATLLSKLLNQALVPKDAPEDAVREQKIDGTDLPADFSSEVAPLLGTGGIVMESQDNGWSVTALVLKKNDRANIATKPKDSPK